MLLLFVGVSVFIVTVLVNIVTRNKGDILRFGLVLSTVFSYGMLYAYERGNIAILAWILTLCFLLSYNSNNRIRRELGLIALALAAGLKLYPALYGLLLLRRGRLGQAARAMLYGVLCIILPLLFFNEGLMGLGIWLNVLFSGNPLVYGTTALNYSAKTLLVVIGNLLGLQLNIGLITVLAVILSLIPLVTGLLQKELWKQLFGITLGFLLFSSQSAYGLSYFLIPLLLSLRDEDLFSRPNVVYLLGMMLLVINVPLFSDPLTGLPRLMYYQIIFVALFINSIADLARILRGFGKQPTQSVASI